MPLLTHTHHIYLSLPKGGSRRHLLFEHISVKTLHQFGCCLIVHLPQTSYHPRSPCIHEATCQTNQPFSSDLLTKPCPAGTHNHKFNRQGQVINIPQPQETIFRFPPPIH